MRSYPLKIKLHGLKEDLNVCKTKHYRSNLKEGKQENIWKKCLLKQEKKRNVTAR
jgi:hypothetical protein